MNSVNSLYACGRTSRSSAFSGDVARLSRPSSVQRNDPRTRGPRVPTLAPHAAGAAWLRPIGSPVSGRNLPPPFDASGRDGRPARPFSVQRNDPRTRGPRVPTWTLLIALAALTFSPAQAQVDSTHYAVQVSATTQASPARITLAWPQDPAATGYTVSRKAPAATAWETGTALPGTASSFVDANVVAGRAYEYQVVRTSSTATAYGYVQAGFELPLVDARGTVVLVVDNTHAAALAFELARLEQDLAGDGWRVVRRDVAPTDSVGSVKAQIKVVYDADRANVKAVFLLGRVPVPYSGLLAPDGHSDHIGAWPADVFYGEMDGYWSDTGANYLQTQNPDPAERERLSNVPGDGKFDQSSIPSAVELEVGRVDLSRMPGRVGGVATFPSEVELLRQYLNKDHAFRHRITRVQRRGIVGDYFGPMGGEAFAASGYRGFAPLFGADRITNLNAEHANAGGVWVPTLANNDYLMAYGSGPGTYTSMGGIGGTTDLVGNNIRAVFTFVCGSYLGDWDSEDNIMRAVLATPEFGLTAAWSGRPHWFIHPMGLGETIGYATRLTQNNIGLYRNARSFGVNQIHIALMGDPTLRLHPVAPVSGLIGSFNGSSAALSWTAPADAVIGYHVYRATSAAGPFTRLTAAPVTGTSFADNTATSGLTYMVRAVKLEVTPSGSYYNASQGLFWSTGGTASAETTTTATTTKEGASTSSSTTDTSTTDASTSTITSTSTTSDANTSGSTAAKGGAKATGQPAAAVNDSGDFVWFDDALPAGAAVTASGGDGWNWVSAPAFSGTKAHQSNLAAGLHEHGFDAPSSPMLVGVGDTLFAYIFIDPANPPAQIMLSWHSGNTEHRAYWGANRINHGKPGTASRRHIGPMPRAGEWVLLDVPAAAVDLDGRTVTGMTFSLFGGRATWDYTGKVAARGTDQKNQGRKD